MAKNLKIRKNLIIALTICMGVSLSVILSGIVYKEQKKRLEYEFILSSNDRFELIKDHINAHIELLYTLGGLYASSGHVERQEFGEFVKVILSNYPDIMAIDWMPRILDSQRIEFEESVRKEGYSDFEIRDIDSHGNFVRAGKRNEYFPVYYLEPFPENKDRFGLDIWFRRTDKMQQASDKNTMVISLRSRTEQKKYDGYLFCRLFLPIYRNDAPIDTIEHRRENLIGFVSEVFRINDLIAASLKNTLTAGMDIYIYDLTSHKDRELIYSWPSRLQDKASKPAKQNNRLEWSRTFDFAENKWLFISRSANEAMLGYVYWQAGIVLVIGLGLTAILALYLFTVLEQSARIEELVDIRTKELNLAKETLEDLKNRIELILNSAGEGILGLDCEGKVAFINKFALDLLGYDKLEVIGKSSHELWHHSKPDGSLYLEEECKLYAASKDRVVRKVEDEVFWKKDKTSFSVEYTSTPILEKGVSRGAVVVFKDISERKRVEDKISEAYKVMRDILNMSPFGIYIVNDKGGIDYVNPAMLNIAGTSYEEFMNLNVFTLPTYRHIGLDEKIKSAVKGEFFVMKNITYTSYVSKKVTVRDFTGMPLEEAGQKKALVFVEDITERRRLEQLKDEFISNVSHELRTPLSIIKEGISLVLDKIIGDINPQQVEVLSISKSNIDRLARVINGLLDISKIESGKLELKKADVDIVDLIKQTAVSFEQKIKEAGIELKLDFGSEKIIAYIDADMITQVFMNLIANALKFTRQGFIKIFAAEKNNKVECVVEDTGIGIAPENIPHLFEKFQQFSRMYGTGEKGTGLGLSIAKGIIDMHNGDIRVESSLGAGTKFIFSLPKTKEILP